MLTFTGHVGLATCEGAIVELSASGRNVKFSLSICDIDKVSDIANDLNGTRPIQRRPISSVAWRYFVGGNCCCHVFCTECCLGTMTWGSQNTEAQAHEQLNYAFDEAGLNILDTAEMCAPLLPPRSQKYMGFSWTDRDARGLPRRGSQPPVICQTSYGVRRETCG